MSQFTDKGIMSDADGSTIAHEGALIIFSHSADHTTARYFENAAKRTMCSNVRYVSEAKELATIGPNDTLFIVDPIETWCVGMEDLPCLKIGYLIDTHLGYDFRTDLGSWCDLLFVVHRKYMKRLRDDGHKNVFWTPVAADPEVHFVGRLDRVFDLSFVGKIGDLGSRRFEILSSVLPRFRTNEYWRWHDPQEMGRVYSQSKIVINACTNDDITMRVFEAMCSGALLVTDHADGLDALFTEGKHYVGYSSADEAVDRIAYYLSHPKERIQIATAGQRLALSAHTYARRLEQILSIAGSRNFKGASLATDYSNFELAATHARIFLAIRDPVGVLAVMRRYGFDTGLLKRFLHACGRLVNAKVPITPRAIYIKGRNLRSQLKVWLTRQPRGT